MKWEFEQTARFEEAAGNMVAAARKMLSESPGQDLAIIYTSGDFILIGDANEWIKENREGSAAFLFGRDHIKNLLLLHDKEAEEIISSELQYFIYRIERDRKVVMDI